MMPSYNRLSNLQGKKSRLSSSVSPPHWQIQTLPNGGTPPGKMKRGRGADPNRYHHHHHRLTLFFRATARVRRFSRMPLLHTAQSCVSSALNFNFDMSSSTHSRHVFLAY